MLGLHTLDARDNSLIRSIFYTFAHGDPQEFRDAIQLEAQHIRDLLKEGGVNYEELKSALVPTHDGVQAVFLYDWLDHPGWNYAVAFADLYLPHLRKDLHTSVFQGDLLAQNAPYELFESHRVSARGEDIEWRTQFAVYFNNLRPTDVETLHRELSSDPRYRGYIDVTLASPIRDYLARCIPAKWVLHGRKVILSHGGDEPLVSDEDPVGFDLPGHGYEIVSLLDSYYYGFMSYKIESGSSAEADEDRVLTLAAVLGELIDIESVEIVVPPAKIDAYLLREPNKLRLMSNIGLQEVTPDELAEIIREKLLGSYVYDFRFAVDGTPLFAVACEFVAQDERIVRRLLALKYNLASAAISLVTMY